MHALAFWDLELVSLSWGGQITRVLMHRIFCVLDDYICISSVQY